MKQKTIPIVDFSELAINQESTTSPERIGNEIFEAFSTVGFVYLKNTGISTEVINEANGGTNFFFEKTAEEKEKLNRDPDTNFGYIGISCERVDQTRPGDYRETFNVGGEALKNVHSPAWPNKEFAEISIDLIQSCKKLTLNILKALAIGMKLSDSDFFAKAHSLLNKEGNASHMRFLYYPPVKGNFLKPGQIRLGEHSDYGSITLLFQDQVGGLQIQNLEGDYIDATPIEGTVLVNIGDILQFWAGNKLKSTKHRILVPETESQMVVRRSIVYFAKPNNDINVNSVFKYKDSNIEDANIESSKEPLTAIEYYAEKLAKINV